MSDTILDRFTTGQGKILPVDHTGPASYTTGGETVGTLNNLTGIALLGLDSVDFVEGSGSLSLSGNYTVQVQQIGTGVRKQFKLKWLTAAGNAGAVVVVTPGASPYAYTATSAGTLVIAGGTVSAVTITRGAATAVTLPTAGPITVAVGDIVTITYSSLPTVTFLPSGTGSEVASGTSLTGETVRLAYIGK
jgi:hypothetical protein